MSNGLSVTVPPWAGKVTRCPRILFPVKWHTAVHIVSPIRALLLEDRLPARQQYQGLVERIGEAIGRGRWDVWPYIAPVSDDDGNAVQQFVDDYLESSENGLTVLTGLVTLDALGIDIMAFDAARAEAPGNAYSVVYGKQNKARTEYRSQLKRAGWRQLDDEAEKDRGRMWVSAHHVRGSVKDAVLERYQDSFDHDVYDMWRKRLRPIDVALGREKTPGPLRSRTRGKPMP
ncbi:MAG: hypothetical protein HQ475_11155 [SAR202 cluster bacterium]|nr:hypothetical protein [SAR202 cluster bacterium]